MPFCQDEYQCLCDFRNVVRIDKDARIGVEHGEHIRNRGLVRLIEKDVAIRYVEGLKVTGISRQCADGRVGSTGKDAVVELGRLVVKFVRYTLGVHAVKLRGRSPYGPECALLQKG